MPTIQFKDTILLALLTITGCGLTQANSDEQNSVASRKDALRSMSFVKIESSQNNSYAIDLAGNVWAWGRHNALGNKRTAFPPVDSLTPVQVSGISNIQDIFASVDHVLALGKDGSVYCWGRNTYNQCSPSSLAYIETPVKISTLSDVVRVAAGGSHSLALLADGTVMAWGDNALGQLGDGAYVSKSTPQRVPGMSNVTEISALGGGSLAVKLDGSAWWWGNMDSCLDPAGATVPTPTQLTGLSNVVAIAGGAWHGAALTSDGSVFTFGFNGGGALGIGSDPSCSKPIKVVGIPKAIQIAALLNATMMIGEDGSVWGWGNNPRGILGIGRVGDVYLPVKNPYLTGIVQIAGHSVSALALDSKLTSVSAWGANTSGQLGDGTKTDRLSPVLTRTP